MKRLSFTLLLLYGVCIIHAQRTITGTISDEEGANLADISIKIKGDTSQYVSLADGTFQVNVPEKTKYLFFSHHHYQTQKVSIQDTSFIAVILTTQKETLLTTPLEEKRLQNTLGYATQTIAGEILADTHAPNLIDALAGKVSALQIRTQRMMGGSSNILSRGIHSLLGDNQALFVVDGVALNNAVFNEATQRTGHGGYDYGNLANDINIEDIASISILKGAAATALYGARGANGAILVQLKKAKARKGVGVSFSSSMAVDVVNPETAPQYQREYGAGYGAFYGASPKRPPGYFYIDQVDNDDNDDLIVPTGVDASWGAPFDPNFYVIHWDALDPNAANYGKKRPYVAPASTILDFFETGITLKNHLAIEGGTEQANLRLAYTNDRVKGILPNAKAQKHRLAFQVNQQLGARLQLGIQANYVQNATLGRGNTGYDRLNVMRSLGQWFQANLDMNRLEANYLNANGTHQPWNRSYWNSDVPLDFDNPYYIRYRSYQNDQRNRLFGHVLLNYHCSNALSLQARITHDGFSDEQEERIAKQSVDRARYTKRLRNYQENNLEVLVRYQKQLGKAFNLYALVGGNQRINRLAFTGLSTHDELVVDGLFNLATINPKELEATEALQRSEQRSAFAQLHLAFKDYLYLDITGRNDWFSALSKGNRSQLYPSAALSFMFSDLLFPHNYYFNFGKLRLNYAQVGSEVHPYQTNTSYVAAPDFAGQASFSFPAELYNANLRPERTNSYEAGLELHFLNSRYGLDISFYQANTSDLMLPAPLSRASGYTTQLVNAGKVENKGVELALFLKPIQRPKIAWSITANWSKNKNTVVELAPNVENLQIGAHFLMTYNAVLGEPYGTFRGTDYQHHENGERLISPVGFYEKTERDDLILGHSNPDWTAGVYNEIRLGKVCFTALFDMREGGSIYSLNTMFGQTSGLYAETAGLNDLGNPKRDPVTKGGGIQLKGVQADGSPNQVYALANDYFGRWNFDNNPTAAYIFDASYIKLREASIAYTFSSKKQDKKGAKVTLRFFSRNLAILKKNVQHFDPEQGLSASNIQGFEVGAYPTTRTLGVQLKWCW